MPGRRCRLRRPGLVPDCSRVDLAPSERDLLLRIYQAECRWADGGQDDRRFLLMHTGGMERVLDHPGWDGSWPTPTSRQIDDLEEYDLLRVEPHAPNMKNRTFQLSTHGRRVARNFTQASDAPDVPPPDPSSSPPSLDDVLAWFAELDENDRADGQRLLHAATARFGAAHLEAVSGLLFDLEEERLIKFTNPMATLTGWSVSTRIGKGSNFRITVPGIDHVNSPQRVAPGPTFNIHGNVSQLAGRDIITQITVTQEIVDLALQELDRRPDIDDTTREGARSLIERAKGRTTEVLVAAAGTDVGALALEVIKHALRAKGISF
jgi:DNA-binding MarR family transcriptional regulator